MKKSISIALLSLCLHQALAQNCSANLGNPLINTSFGAGPGFGQPLPPGATTLTYAATACPELGQYSIINSIPACPANGWQAISNDHTGDYNGYFMLANGSSRSTDLSVQTISGFCQGTTYQFAAWLLNMASPSAGNVQPNLRFTIEQPDGTVLQSFTTGAIPVSIPMAWIQYAFYYSIPPGLSTLVLRIRLLGAAGAGNAIALDDITFRAAGPAVDIQADAFPGNAGIVCTGSSITFSSGTDKCYIAPAWQWQVSADNGTTWSEIAGATNPTCTVTFTTTGTGLYRLKKADAGNISSAWCSVFSNPITVVAQDGPMTALSISPSANPVCAGAAVTFTADATNGGPAPFYLWKINGRDAAVGSNTFTSSSLSDGDVITCVMTSSIPCAHPGTLVSNAVKISVLPSPTPAVSITSSSGVVCVGMPVLFTAWPVNGGTSPSYQWQVNGIDAGNNSNTFSSTSLATGDVVTCTMTSNAACAVPATVRSDPQPVKVNAYVIPALSISASATSICPGSPVTFTASPGSGGSNPSFQWQVNGIDAGNGASITTSNITDNSVVTCTMTSSDACANPATAQSNAIPISVLPASPPSLTISLSVNPICAGAPVTFTANAVGGGSAPQYEWRMNGNPIGAAGGNTFTSNSLADGDQVSCILTSSSTCAVPAIAVSNTVSISVKPLVAPSVSISPSANPACSGRPVTFLATSVNAGAAPKYQWLVNGNNNNTTGDSIFTSNLLADGDVVSCILTSNAACADPATAGSNPVSLSVTPSPKPAIEITASQNSICAGMPVNFTATGNNGGAAPAYQWQVNGAAAGTGTSFSSSTLADGDVVSCLLISNAICAYPSTVLSDPIAMKIYALPVIPPGQVFYAYYDQPLTLTPSITGAIDSITWTPSLGLSDSTITDPVADLTAPMQYSLYVVSPGGCKSNGSVKVEVSPRLSIPGAFTPNGDGHNDVFYILGGTPAVKIKQLEIFDRWGLRVFGVQDAVPGDRRFGWNGRFNGAPAPPGTYIYMATIDPGDGHLRQYKGTFILLR